MHTISESNNNIESIHEINCISSLTIYCEKCKVEVLHETKESFDSVPDILIIGLVRFESETIDGTYTDYKKQDCVTPSKKITVNDNYLDLMLKAVSSISKELLRQVCVHLIFIMRLFSLIFRL